MTPNKPGKKTPGANAVLTAILCAAAGLAAGCAIKLLDLYTTNLGNIFSQLSVWFFLCTLLTVFSGTPARAAVRVFVFCIGMLAAYYAAAEWTHSVYSMQFVYGWTAFAFFTPLMSLCLWAAGRKRRTAVLCAVGLPLCMLACAAVLFDQIRVSDVVFAVLTSAVFLKRATGIRMEKG